MYKVYKTKKPDYHGVYIESIDELKTETVSAFSFHYELDELEEATIATDLILSLIHIYHQRFEEKSALYFLNFCFDKYVYFDILIQQH